MPPPGVQGVQQLRPRWPSVWDLNIGCKRLLTYRCGAAVAEVSSGSIFQARRVDFSIGFCSQSSIMHWKHRRLAVHP